MVSGCHSCSGPIRRSESAIAVLRIPNFRHRVLTPAAASVGLAGLSPHDLRHTAASLAIAAGANVGQVPADEGKCVVGRVGLEPTTQGL